MPTAFFRPYQRSPGGTFYCQFIWPAGIMGREKRHRTEKCLHTTDREKAQILAYEQIAACKRIVHQWRALKADTTVRGEWFKQEPGTVIHNQDGTRTSATAETIFTFDRADQLISTAPNQYRVDKLLSFPVPDKDAKLIEKADALTKGRSVDDRILDAWVKKNDVSPTLERQGRAVYEDFVKLTGKTLATARRSDGRALADHYFSQGQKSQTVERKVGHLRAAVFVALDLDDEFSMIKKNAFSGVVAKRDDEDARQAFDDNEMATIYADLPNWTDDERLLWVICATHGVRRSEVWDITREETVSGIRCIHIGADGKTASSDRKVPISSAAIPFLPAVIEGPLFAPDVTPKNLGKKVLRRIRALGITDPAKVLHSTRHRASTRMNGVQDSMRDAVLGHDDNGGRGKKRASKRYFGGHPVADIRDAVERIQLF